MSAPAASSSSSSPAVRSDRFTVVRVTDGTSQAPADAMAQARAYVASRGRDYISPGDLSILVHGNQKGPKNWRPTMDSNNEFTFEVFKTAGSRKQRPCTGWRITVSAAGNFKDAMSVDRREALTTPCPSTIPPWRLSTCAPCPRSSCPPVASTSSPSNGQPRVYMLDTSRHVPMLRVYNTAQGRD